MKPQKHKTNLELDNTSQTKPEKVVSDGISTANRLATIQKDKTGKSPQGEKSFDELASWDEIKPQEKCIFCGHLKKEHPVKNIMGTSVCDNFDAGQINVFYAGEKK